MGRDAPKHIGRSMNPDDHELTTWNEFDTMIRLEDKLDNFKASVANKEGVNYLTKNGFDTYHPTLSLSNKNQCAAWLEGLHRPDSEFAYNVEYISPAQV